MKFSTVLLATTVTALVTPRDLATVKGVITNVQNGIDSLKTVAEGFSGDTKPVVDESNKLITTVNDGTTTVKGSSDLTTSEALGLLTPVKELKKHAQALSDAFLDRRSDVEKAKACDITHSQIGKLKTASGGLIDAITAKVPASVRNIAKEQADQINAVLDEAETNFNEQNCHDA